MGVICGAFGRFFSFFLCFCFVLFGFFFYNRWGALVGVKQ